MKSILKKPLFKILCIFNSLWLLYYILELFSGNLQGTYAILINLFVPLLFLSLMALMFYSLSLHTPQVLAAKKIISAILVLVLIEQGTKLVIRSIPGMGTNYELIRNWLYFYPLLNTLGSWGASRFGLKLGIKAFLVINILIIPLIIQIYRFYIREKGHSYWANTTFVLCFSGVLCSMIDKMFFGGSLDFLMLNNLFVADIKDFYLTLSIGCLLAEMFLNPNVNIKGSSKDDLDLFKKFIAFNVDCIKKFHFPS